MNLEETVVVARALNTCEEASSDSTTLAKQILSAESVNSRNRLLAQAYRVITNRDSPPMEVLTLFEPMGGPIALVHKYRENVQRAYGQLDEYHRAVCVFMGLHTYIEAHDGIAKFLGTAMRGDWSAAEWSTLKITEANAIIRACEYDRLVPLERKKKLLNVMRNKVSPHGWNMSESALDFICKFRLISNVQAALMDLRRRIMFADDGDLELRALVVDAFDNPNTNPELLVMIVYYGFMELDAENAERVFNAYRALQIKERVAYRDIWYRCVPGRSVPDRSVPDRPLT